MGAHDILFWMSLAAGFAAVCLLAMLKASRGPPREDLRNHETDNVPSDRI